MTTVNVPYNEDIERAVLGALLVNFTHAPLVQLNKADFYLTRHQHIYDGMKHLQASGVAVDRMTLKDLLAKRSQYDMVGGDAYMSTLMSDAAPSYYVSAYAELVRRDSIRRRGMVAIDRMRGIVSDKELSVEQVVSKMQGELQSVRNAIGDETIKNTNALTDEMLMLTQFQEPGVIPTGYSRLDQNLGGGIRRGNLAIFAAASGVGKTWTAINIALNVARQKRVDGRKNRILYFTQEMTTATEFNPRLLSVLSGDGEPLTTTELESAGRYIKPNKDKMKRLAALVSEFDGFEFVVDERASVSPAYVRDMVTIYKPDLVVIDYLTLMHSDDNHNSRHTMYSAIIKELKEIAKESGETATDKAAFLVLAQLNRESIKTARDADRPPYKEALKESGDIENHSAQIVMIWQTDEMEDTNVISFAVRKNRYGDEYKGTWRKNPPAALRNPHTGRMVEVRVEVDGD